MNANWTAFPVALGIIPTGSGNSLANTLGLSSKNVIEAIEIILAQKTHNMDLMLVGMKKKEVLSFCVISWGLHARTVVDSEKLRFMGPSRFRPVCLGNIIFGNTHQGTVTLPNQAKFLIQNTFPLTPCERKLIEEKERMKNPNVQNEEEEESNNSNNNNNNKNNNNNNNEDISTTTYYFEDYFVASKMRELSKGFVLTPHSNIADRLIDIIFTKEKTPKKEMWNFLISAGEDAKHLTFPCVNYVKTDSFQVQTLTHTSPLCVDGEFYECPDKFSVSIHPSFHINIFRA